MRRKSVVCLPILVELLHPRCVLNMAQSETYYWSPAMAFFAQLLSFFISALKCIPWVVFLRGEDGKPHSVLQTKSLSCKAGHGLDCLIEDDLLTNESERMNHSPPANSNFWQLLASCFRSWPVWADKWSFCNQTDRTLTLIEAAWISLWPYKIFRAIRLLIHVQLQLWVAWTFSVRRTYMKPESTACCIYKVVYILRDLFGLVLEFFYIADAIVLSRYRI